MKNVILVPNATTNSLHTSPWFSANSNSFRHRFFLMILSETNGVFVLHEPCIYSPVSLLQQLPWKWKKRVVFYSKNQFFVLEELFRRKRRRIGFFSCMYFYSVNSITITRANGTCHVIGIQSNFTSFTLMPRTTEVYFYSFQKKKKWMERIQQMRNQYKRKGWALLSNGIFSSQTTSLPLDRSFFFDYYSSVILNMSNISLFIQMIKKIIKIFLDPYSTWT